MLTFLGYIFCFISTPWIFNRGLPKPQWTRICQNASVCSGSIKTHEVFGSIKTHEVSRGEVSIKTWGFWVHQNTWGFERGKTWLGSIKSLELFGSIKTHEVFCSEKHPLVYNWQPNFRLQVLQNFHLHLNFCLTDLWYNTELASRGKPLLGSTNSVLWLPTLGVRGQSPC